MTTHPVAVDAHGATVADMFDNIADRYDLMNLVMTWGQEPRFIRDTIDAVKLGPTPKVLDIATGTGDWTASCQSTLRGRSSWTRHLPEMLEFARTPGAKIFTGARRRHGPALCRHHIRRRNPRVFAT